MLLATLGAALTLATTASAQIKTPPPQQQPRVPNYRPTISPYINLLNTNNDFDRSLLYLGIVQPQQDNLKFQQQQQSQLQQLNKDVMRDNGKLQLQQQQMIRVAEVLTGKAQSSAHRGAFNQRRYFPRSSGAR
jgi:TolA-binding protein